MDLEIAAALIDASFTGTFLRKLKENGEEILTTYKIYDYLLWSRSIFIFLLMAFSFFERPSWCYRKDCLIPADPQNIIPGEKPILLFSVFPKLDYQSGLILEFFCIVSIWFCTAFFSFFIVGVRNTIFKNFGSVMITFLSVISIADILVSFFVVRSWRLSQFMRPFLFIFVIKSVRSKLWRFLFLFILIFKLHSFIIK